MQKAMKFQQGHQRRGGPASAFVPPGRIYLRDPETKYAKSNKCW